MINDTIEIGRKGERESFNRCNIIRGNLISSDNLIEIGRLYVLNDK